MARRHFYIPDELDARVELVKDEINISRVCALALEAEVERIEAGIKQRRADEATVIAVRDIKNDPTFKAAEDAYEFARNKYGEQLAQMRPYEAEGWLNGYVNTAGTILTSKYKPGPSGE